MCKPTYSNRVSPSLLASVLLGGVVLTGCFTDTAPTVQVDEEFVTHCRKMLKPHLKRGFNQGVAFYVDLTRPSNQNRFFVLDLRHNRVLARGLCCNGRTDAQGHVLYSNENGSNCSSKGAVRISYRYRGQFGKAYKLEGLERSNSNLFARAVVLHAHGCIPPAPQPESICVSEGCPTVNPAFLKALAGYIDHSAKPILLYIE